MPLPSDIATKNLATLIPFSFEVQPSVRPSFSFLQIKLFGDFVWSIGFVLCIK